MPDDSKPPMVTLSRRAFFSVGRRLRNAAWDEETNRTIFGINVLPHGNEYRLEVAFSGPVAQEDGIIVNLTEIKPVINEVINRLDGMFFDGNQNFQLQPTAENLALFIWEALPKSVGAGTLWRIKLQESRRTLVSLSLQRHNETPIMKVQRSYEFAAAHRLHSPHLSEDENLRRFDKCSNYYGHGHNFGLEVVVQGEPDPETGFLIAPQLLDRIVEEEVFTRFDHKHLNLDCPEFENLIPSSENLAQVIFDVLKRRLNQEGYQLARVGLHETQKNYFEVEA